MGSHTLAEAFRQIGVTTPYNDEFLASLAEVALYPNPMNRPFPDNADEKYW